MPGPKFKIFTKEISILLHWNIVWKNLSMRKVQILCINLLNFVFCCNIISALRKEKKERCIQAKRFRFLSQEEPGQEVTVQEVSQY